jgi:3-hydroxybutyryl-CoA dehydratase
MPTVAQALPHGKRAAPIGRALLSDFAAMNGLYLEDLKVGMSAMFGKTVTEADIVAYAGVSGDTNPIHLHDGFARTTRFGQRIAHGMLSGSFISAVIGTKLPGPGSVYISQTIEFKAPVLIGETITAVATITAIDERRRRVTLKTQCLNGDKVVIDGEAQILVPRRDAS